MGSCRELHDPPHRQAADAVSIRRFMCRPEFQVRLGRVDAKSCTAAPPHVLQDQSVTGSHYVKVATLKVSDLGTIAPCLMYQSFSSHTVKSRTSECAHTLTSPGYMEIHP